MKKKILFTLWGVLYVLCAGLGFLPQPEGFSRYVLTGVSILFFLPGFVLLAQAKRSRDKQTLKLIFTLSAASLVLTTGAIIANFLSIAGSKALGDGLYAMLVIVSSPMVCSGYWALSIFLWACLMTISLMHLKQPKTGR